MLSRFQGRLLPLGLAHPAPTYPRLLPGSLESNQGSLGDLLCPGQWGAALIPLGHLALRTRLLLKEM